LAKLAALPNATIIAGFKGKIDFYVHKGIPCARRWPVITGHRSTIGEKRNQNRFRYFQKSLKAYSRGVKDLWRATAALANWRWHEVAYRWFSGNGLDSIFKQHASLFPLRKPWPPTHDEFWFLHHAYWWFQEPNLYLIFWPDRTNMRLTLVTSPRKPNVRTVVRIERGVSKLCGYEPHQWIGQRYRPMDTGFYFEEPPTTSFIHVPGIDVDLLKEPYAQVVGVRGPEYPGEPYEATNLDYSVSPPMKLNIPVIPGAIRDGQMWEHPIDPIAPLDYFGISPKWTLHTTVYRSYRWPQVSIPGGGAITVTQNFPLEELPAVIFQPPV